MPRRQEVFHLNMGRHEVMQNAINHRQPHARKHDSNKRQLSWLDNKRRLSHGGS